MADNKISELPGLAGPLTGAEPMIFNQGGVTRQGTAQDVFDAVPANPVFEVETFVDTVDYTAGVSNQLILVETPISKDNIVVVYEGVEQDEANYTLAGNTITFTSTIPVGVTVIKVRILKAT